MIFPIAPSLGRYGFWIVGIFIESFMMTRWIPESKGHYLFLVCIPGYVVSFSYLFRYKVTIQTKQKMLGEMYGLVVSSFLFNVLEMVMANVGCSVNYLFFLFSAQYFYWNPILLVHIRLVYKADKLIINPYHFFLIIIFSLFTATLIWPYAYWFNWVCHFYSCCLALEISVITCTKEFKWDNPCEKKRWMKYTGTVHFQNTTVISRMMNVL